MFRFDLQKLRIKLKTLGIRVKYCIAKYKMVTKILLFILLFASFSFGYEILGKLFADADSNTIGVYGALFGALIGGVISLGGSIWVHNRQLKSMAEIKRKQEIFTPLYDELIRLNNELFEFNSYPEKILIRGGFHQGDPIFTNLPTYWEWTRIRNSTSYLELPEILKHKMNELKDSIEDYNEAFREARKEMSLIIDNIVRFERRNYDVHSSTKVLTRVLRETKVEYFRGFLDIRNTSKTTETAEEFDGRIIKLQSRIEDEVQNSEKINKVKGIYTDLEQTQKEIIEIVELIFKTTVQKYEK